MNTMRDVFVKQMWSPAFMAAALGLMAAGCSSTSGPPPSTVPPPPLQGQVPPPPAEMPLPPVALSADQMTKICQEAPDTCHRIQMAQPLTLADVKVMAKLPVPPDVIITTVRNSRTVFHLTANNIIDLKNSGVSDQVIDFLISTPNSIAGLTPVPEPQTNSTNPPTPPPPPPDETAPPAPGPDYAWVGGDWVWNDGRSGFMEAGRMAGAAVFIVCADTGADKLICLSC